MIKLFYSKDVTTFDKFMRILARLQELILILVSLFLALGITYMAALRYIFKADLFGMEELVLIAGMYLYFVGSSYGSYEQSHIKASVLNVFIDNERMLNKIELVQQVLTTGIVLMMAYYCIGFMQFSIEAGARTAVLKIPFYVGHASLAVGLSLMAYFHIFHLINFIRNFLKTNYEEKLQKED